MRGQTSDHEKPGAGKSAEDTRRPEDLYQAIFENAVEGIFQSTLGGRFLNVNPAMARMYGYASPQEMLSGVADITRQVYSDRDLYIKFVQLLKKNGKVEKFEAPNHRKDGTIFWTSTSARAVYAPDGHLEYYEGFVQDITETRHAQDALRESETLYRQAMEASGAVPYHEVYHRNGAGYKVKYTFVGEGIRQITGYGPEEFTDILWDSLILEAHPLDELAEFSMKDAVDRVRSGSAQVWRCEFKIRARDGSIRWVYETAVDQRDQDGNAIGSIGSFQDITERKLAEASLHESEQRSKIVTEMTTDYLFIVDVRENGELVLRWASENMEKLTGRTVDEISSSILWDRIIHPDDLQVFNSFTRELIMRGEPGDLECRVFTESGAQRWIQIFVQPQKMRNGRVTSIIGAIKDISERKKTEQALRESEEMLRSIFRVVPTGMGVMVDRIFTDINPRVCEMTGFSREELIGQNARMLYPTQEEFDVVGRERTGQIAEKGSSSLETRWKKRDGTIINIILAFTPIDGNDPTRGLTFTVMDITERKRSEDAMRAIAEVGRDISSTLHLDVVLHRIASYAKHLLNTLSSAVYLAETGTSALRAITAIGDDAEEIMSDPVTPGEGILGNIVLSKYGEIVNNTDTDARGIQIKGTEVIPYEHLMGIPVMIKDRLTGLIAVWRVGEGQEFKQTDLDFLTSLAQQVAVAIDNARLFEETQHRLREMEAMVQVSATLSRTIELDSLLQEILDTAIRAIPVAERGSILLADENRNLNIRAVSGYSDPRVRNYSFPPNAGYAMKSFREVSPIVIPDVRADTAIRYEGDIREMLFNGSAVATPLVVKGKAIGVITIDTPSKKDAFKQGDLQLLTAMAASAGLAIENARLFDETRRRLTDLEILHSISSALRTASNLEEAQPILLNHLVNLMDAGGAALEILEPVTGEVVTQLAIGAWEPLTGMRMPGDTGISGFVVSTGQPYLSGDVIGDRITDRPDLFFGLNCVACVPVNSQQSTIGTLWIGRKTRIREEEVSLLISIGEMVGNAINRMVLHEQTTQHLNRLNALHMIERVINSSLDINITLEILLEHVVAQLNAQGAGILLLNPRMFTLEYFAIKGLRKDKTQSVVRLGEDAASRVVLERSTISLTHLSEKRHEHARLIQMVDDAQCYHATPLIAKGQVRGVLEVFHHEEHSPESEWVSFLQSLAEQAAIAVDNAELFKNLQRTNEELSLAYDDTISGWARALDLREKETANHSFRVTDLTLRLAQAVGVDESKLQHIRRGALLHDIGKMGIPDSILLKQDVLTPEEWEMMKLHPVYSYELLRSISYLLPAIDIPHFHHEKWDGTGYPLGLKGEAIPQAARIFAVVDVWDALRSARPYRAAWPEAEVRNYLRTNSGTHFDPVVVDIFLKMMEVTNPDWALSEIVNH